MVSVRSRLSAAVLLSALAALFLAASWEYLQLSWCVGDLKSGTRDVPAALALENRAFHICLAGPLLVSSAALQHSFGRARRFWSRAVVLVAASPALGWVAFLALALFPGAVPGPVGMCANPGRQHAALAVSLRLSAAARLHGGGTR